MPLNSSTGPASVAPPSSQAPSSPGDDLGSTDEVKVFKDEGDKEDENISGENLLEEKSSLIDLTESEVSSIFRSCSTALHKANFHSFIRLKDKSSDGKNSRPDLSPLYSKMDAHHPGFNVGYLVSPYTYANGAAGALPVSMVSSQFSIPISHDRNAVVVVVVVAARARKKKPKKRRCKISLYFFTPLTIACLPACYTCVSFFSYFSVLAMKV